MSLTFAFPALLAGAAAAAIPWLLHLLLRPRPRRVRFPPAGMLAPLLSEGRRARRLRDFWLLALRTTLIGLLALVLAGPRWQSASADAPPSAPDAIVIVLDESLSMDYQTDAGSLATRARQRVRAALAEVPIAGSARAWALCLSAEPDADARWTDRPAQLAARLAGRAAPPNALPLGRALQAAARLLRESTAAAKRLDVHTDLAAHAWRDVPRGLLSGVGGLRVRVLAGSPESRGNLSIRRVEGIERVVSSAAPTALRVEIGATAAQATCRVQVSRDGTPLARSAPATPADGRTRDVELRLGPLPAGVHGLTFELEPSDRLAFDQVRFAAVEAAQRPTAILLADPAPSSEAGLTIEIIANLIAPTALADELRPVELQIVAPDALTPEQLGRAALIVVPSGVAPRTGALDGLLAAVRRGARLALVPADDDVPDWPGLRPLLSDAAPERVDAGAVAMRRDASSVWWGADEGLAELERCDVRRRLRVRAPAPGVVVHARYPDGSAALLSVPHGAGEVWMLTTSPHPTWSELGVRAAGLMTLFDRLIADAVGPPAGAANFTAAERSRRRFAGLPTDRVVRVDCRSDPSQPDAWLRLDRGVPERDWPTARAGLYAIEAADSPTAHALYAVNWPPEESDLAPITPAEIGAILGVAHVEPVFDALDGADGRRRGGSLVPDAEALLGGLLLAVLLAESWAAHRGRARAPAV